MNKRKILIITLLLGIAPLTAFGTTITKDSTIFDVINLIKSTIKFNTITIESKVPYDTIQSAIEKYCPSAAVNEARSSEKTMVNTRSTINSENKNQILKERFLLLKKTIVNHDTKDEYKYCKENYLLFSLLKVTQELYNGDRSVTKSTQNYTQQTNGKITNNQNISGGGGGGGGGSSKSTYTNQNNKQTSTSTNNNTTNGGTHNSATTSTENYTNKVNFTFNHDTSGLPENERIQFSKNTDVYLHQIIDDLVRRNIFNQNDINTLNNKINITYQQTCKTTEGDFHIMRNKETGNLRFKEINLIIAYCDTYNTPEKQKRHVKQIFAHELGHYIYFFKDNNPSEFSEICRENGKINCLPSDFVSSYSRKSPEEDYAESFAHRYLYSSDDSSQGHGSAPDNPIGRRNDYFERLLEGKGEEDEDDEEDKE